MKENNAICQICGTAYHLCMRCEKIDGTWMPWRTEVDTAKCYKAWSVIDMYVRGNMDKEKAAKKLNTLGHIDYTLEKQAVVDEIMADTQKEETNLE